jgi:hypothetical protein
MGSVGEHLKGDTPFLDRQRLACRRHQALRRGGAAVAEGGG